MTAPITQYTTSFASFTPSKSSHEAIHMDILDIDIELPIKNGNIINKYRLLELLFLFEI